MPVETERVTSASALIVVVPAIAVSNKEVIELFTKSPQVLAFSLVTGRARPRSEVYEVDMFYPIAEYLYPSK